MNPPDREGWVGHRWMTHADVNFGHSEKVCNLCQDCDRYDHPSGPQCHAEVSPGKFCALPRSAHTGGEAESALAGLIAAKRAEIERQVPTVRDLGQKHLYRAERAEQERDAARAAGAEYIAQTGPLIACAGLDDPAASYCGTCRGCLMRERDALRAEVETGRVAFADLLADYEAEHLSAARHYHHSEADCNKCLTIARAKALQP